MAISHDPQQFNIVDLSIVSQGQPHNIRQEGHSTSHNEENTPLYGNTPHGCYAKVKSKFQSRRCCLWSSKPAHFILVWNFVVSIGLLCFFDPSLYTTVFNDLDMNLIIQWVSYGASAVLLLFYPLAGYLADIRWGRHKTVINSLCFIFWSPMLATVLGGLATVGSIPIMFFVVDSLSTIQIITLVVLGLVFGLAVFLRILLLLCSLVAFSANVIQYGMDQLHDAPSEDSVLYIHWYLWTSYVGLFLIRVLSLDSFFLFFQLLTDSCSTIDSWNHTLFAKIQATLVLN